MRRRRGIWIAALPAAVLGAAAIGAHASSAAPAGVTARAATTDATYSCRVNRQRFIDVYASATLPPANGQPRQPGLLVLTTGVKSRTKNGVTTTVSQVGIRAVKNGLRIDKSSCSPVKKPIPLKRTGLPGPPITGTSSFRGSDSERCDTAARVLVRLRLTTTNRIPSHALFAIRDDNAKRRPIAFYNWSARKFSVYTRMGCISTG